MIGSVIKKCVDDLKECFPEAFIYKGSELIVEQRNDIYFILDGIKDELEFNCKVIEWLSRPACKGVSEKWQVHIRNGMNMFLKTRFTLEQVSLIYTKLGNCCNREKTKAFINSGYDFAVLKGR